MGESYKFDDNLNKHDVFISYSSKNKNVADAIVADFEQNGIKCWYAPRDILPGQRWVSAIKDAIDSTKIFILLYTNESNDSKQVMNEVALAFNAGKTIVPFRLTDDEMNNELEYYLTRVHWLDAISKPLNENIIDLREYINVILQRNTVDEKSAPAFAISAAQDSDKAADNTFKGRDKFDGADKKGIIVSAAVVALIVVLIVAVTGLKKKNNEYPESLPSTDMNEAPDEAVPSATGPKTTPSTSDKGEPETANNVENDADASDEKPMGEGGTLMSDCPIDKDEIEETQRPALSSFGSIYKRSGITKIKFMSSIPDDETEPGLDVSENKDESVLAWYHKNGGGYYDLVIASDGIIKAPKDCTWLFAYYENLQSIDFGNCFDTSDSESFSGMFAECQKLTQLDLSCFETSKVINMNTMFVRCKALESLDLSNFDTSNVIDFNCMFYVCESLQSLEVSNFNTKNVGNMRCMFYDCKSIKTLDVSGFDTAKVNNMEYMFAECEMLESLKLDKSLFNTKNVTTFEGMFSGCKSIKTLDVDGFDTRSATNMNGMFNNCGKLESLNLMYWNFLNLETADGFLAGHSDSINVLIIPEMEQQLKNSGIILF